MKTLIGGLLCFLFVGRAQAQTFNIKKVLNNGAYLEAVLRDRKIEGNYRHELTSGPARFCVPKRIYDLQFKARVKKLVYDFVGDDIIRIDADLAGAWANIDVLDKNSYFCQWLAVSLAATVQQVKVAAEFKASLSEETGLATVEFKPPQVDVSGVEVSSESHDHLLGLIRPEAELLLEGFAENFFQTRFGEKVADLIEKLVNSYLQGGQGVMLKP